MDALEADMALEEAGEEVPSYLQDEALPDAPDGVVEPLPAAHDGPIANQQPRRGPRRRELHLLLEKKLVRFTGTVTPRPS